MLTGSTFAMEKRLIQAEKRVSILGTGDFGCSLAKRALLNGYQVVLGSRNPGRRDLAEVDPILSRARVVGAAECFAFSDLIILAVPPQVHRQLGKLKHLLDGKVIVDASNAEAKAQTSNAENLAMFLPGAIVVKAFNTISAYAMSAELTDQRPVYVCGDDVAARHVAIQFASELGFLAVNSGGLNQALRLEERNRELLPGWGWPTFVFVLVFVVWMAYSIVRYYVLRESPYTWERLACNVTNKAFGCASVTLLACAFLPGCLAAFTQLANGTKQKRFPKGLDRWLKMRKGLGLYALLCAVLHMVLSMILLSPAYFSDFYLKKSVTIPFNRTADTVVDIDSRMNWNGETVMLVGFLATFAMAILGITSIPSISERMNWREWYAIHSWVGFTSLILCVAHISIKAGPGWAEDSGKAIVQGLTFLSQLLPWFTIALKLILLLPCVYRRVSLIRSGHIDRAGYAHGYDVEATAAGTNGLPRISATSHARSASATGQSNGAYDYTVM